VPASDALVFSDWHKSLSADTKLTFATNTLYLSRLALHSDFDKRVGKIKRALIQKSSSKARSKGNRSH
jgi:hypothetical protein